MTLQRRKRRRLSECGTAGLELAALIPLVSTLAAGIILAATYYYQQAAIVTAVGDCAIVYSAMGPASMAGTQSQQVLESSLNGFGLGDAEYSRSTVSSTIAVCQADFRTDHPVPWNPTMIIEAQYSAWFRLQCYRSDWDGGNSITLDVNDGCTGGNH